MFLESLSNSNLIFIGKWEANIRSQKTFFNDTFKVIFYRIFLCSWNEHGTQDLPAMINYVLKETHQEKLFYVGHSMGTTGFFVMADQHPKMMDKIVLSSLMAPVAYINDCQSPWVEMAKTEEIDEVFINFLQYLPQKIVG